MELKKSQPAVATVNVNMLKRWWIELEYRYDIVRETKASYVGIYTGSRKVF